MNYFRKTKFRETSLIFVAIFIAIIYFTISDSSEEDELDVQSLIDAAVEEAVEEALAANSDEYTDKTDQSATTTLAPVLAVPVDNYWGQYSDGTWAIVRLTDKPDNFEWAWDVFNREDPYGAYGFDEFDENSTLIGTLVDFDCSFNRISKTKEHKDAFYKEEFGEFQTTIEYYDTYLDWAEDNYNLSDEAVITISKIMRGVWTCDYEYLESISTEYLDFVHTGDAYSEVPKFSEYIASFEDNYDDDDPRGKYTYTLGALLYMTPGIELPPSISDIGCEDGNLKYFLGEDRYKWPMESVNPKQLTQNQISKMSMFDNGITKSLIDGTYQGDDGTYGFRLRISSDGVWTSYKYTGHPNRSSYAPSVPLLICEKNESNTDIGSYKGTTPYIKGVRIEKNLTFDSFIIDLEITQDSDLVPNSPFIASCDRERCAIDPEMGPFIPDNVDEWLYISFPGYSIFRNSDGGWVQDDDGVTVSTFNGQREITSDGPILHARAYGEFEGNLELHLGIVPGSTYRTYQTANPQTIVIEVDK